MATICKPAFWNDSRRRLFMSDDPPHSLPAEELDVGELIVEYLKSKSLLAAAQSLQEDLQVVAAKSATEQGSMNVFTSELERKLGMSSRRSGSRGAVAPLHMTPAPLRSPSPSSREDGHPIPATPEGTHHFQRAGRRQAKLITMIPCSTELEAAQLRQQQGGKNSMSNVVFHDPPPISDSAGARAFTPLLVIDSFLRLFLFISHLMPRMLTAATVAQVSIPMLYHPS